MMRYLQTELLRDCGINHFDEWAADFGEVKTDYDYNLLCSIKKQIMTLPQAPTSLRFLFKSSTQQVSSTVHKEIDIFI